MLTINISVYKHMIIDTIRLVEQYNRNDRNDFFAKVQLVEEDESHWLLQITYEEKCVPCEVAGRNVNQVSR